MKVLPEIVENARHISKNVRETTDDFKISAPLILKEVEYASNSAKETLYSGTFGPNKESKLSADIQGKVTDVLVDLGSSVQKGQTLIQLGNSLLKLQLQSVEIQIEGLEKMSGVSLFWPKPMPSRAFSSKSRIGLTNSKSSKSYPGGTNQQNHYSCTV